jgi:putative DNA methylase
LSPNWWIYRRPEKQNWNRWCAIKPIPDKENKRVKLKLLKGSRVPGNKLKFEGEIYDPTTTITQSRSVGKCPNCDNPIDEEVIKAQAKAIGLGHQIYAVAYQQGAGVVEFRSPTSIDEAAFEKAKEKIKIFPKIQIFLHIFPILRFRIAIWFMSGMPPQILD